MELPENCQKAPRVTPEDIEAAIHLEYYFRAILSERIAAFRSPS